MDLRLYDTKTSSLQNLVPIRDGKVGIYLCGPTVQGMPHIGHLRAATSFDVLIRWLRRYGLDITYVRNVTDIDDKILAKSAESGEQWWALAQRFEREFQKAYATLGLIEPTIEPRATGHITDQISLVERLIERGHAYADQRGNVYFDVHSQPDYGSLTHQSLNQMRTTEGEDETEAISAGKRDPRDFALWKSTKEGEPETASWDSPWGRGRPGWHLECSAMAHRYLGEAFDIHGGGIDLRFPHHENEQAQSHAAGYDFANLWVHNAWVTIAGEKMAKSVGNTLDLASLLSQAPAAVIRFALSSVHHRSMIEWSETTLELAGKSWDKLTGFVEDATAQVGEPEVVFMTPDELPAEFTDALNDDLNVAAGLAVVYDHVKRGRRALVEGDREGIQAELKVVRSMLDVLGVDPGSPQWRMTGGDTLQGALDVMINEVLAERALAREEKDWARADQLRDRLAAAGIQVEDGPQGVQWQVTAR